jgi:stage II sporulation protein R
MRFNKKRIISVIKETSSVAHLISVITRFLLVILVICIVYSGSTQKEIADNVVRLHIVANSDSQADQALKLKVRDAILEHMQTQYPNGATRDEAAQYLKNSMPQIKKIASNVLRENGSIEQVNTRYGVFSFPTKEYEDIALPAGMYEAVRVELGSAKGQNWWCVMFPPLCVADANSLQLDEQAMSQLRQGLGQANYNLITDITEKSNVPVKIKFRIVEIVESSKIKLAELISNLF